MINHRDKLPKAQPRRISAKERQALHKIGMHHQQPFKQRPDFVEKVAADDHCEICQQPFARPMAICPRCQNCVFCGGYNNNPADQFCLNCGNQTDPLPADIDVPRFIEQAIAKIPFALDNPPDIVSVSTNEPPPVPLSSPLKNKGIKRA